MGIAWHRILLLLYCTYPKWDGVFDPREEVHHQLFTFQESTKAYRQRGIIVECILTISCGSLRLNLYILVTSAWIRSSWESAVVRYLFFTIHWKLTRCQLVQAGVREGCKQIETKTIWSSLMHLLWGVMGSIFDRCASPLSF